MLDDLESKFFLLQPIDDDGEPLELEYPDPDEVLAEIIEEIDKLSEQNAHATLHSLTEPILEHLLYQVSQVIFNDDKAVGEQCEFYFVVEFQI